MTDCNLKWIIVLVCISVVLAGSCLAILREYKNIKGGKKEFQDGHGSFKDGAISFRFAICLVLVVIGIIGAIYSAKNLSGCTQPQISSDTTKPVVVQRPLVANAGLDQNITLPQTQFS